MSSIATSPASGTTCDVSFATPDTCTTLSGKTGTSKEKALPETAYQQQRLRDHHRIRRFDAGHSKTHCFRTSGDPRQYPFIQINGTDWKNFIVVDVDRSDAYERLLYPGVPRPDWIITNPSTGHAQAGWAIDSVYVGNKSTLGPALFYRAVATALTNAVGGDHNFTGHIVRNPFAESPSGPVEYSSRTTPWRLGELKAHLTTWTDPGLAALGYQDEQPQMWNPVPAGRAYARVEHALTKHVGDHTLGRNCHIFYTTRSRLWKLHSRGERIENHAHVIAHQINSQLPRPLSAREVNGIAASAIRQVHRGRGRPRATATEEPNAYLAALGRRGGRARTLQKINAVTANLVAAREERSRRCNERRKEALRLRRQGEVAEAIAKALGCHTRTIRRYFQQEAARIQALRRDRVFHGGGTHKASGVKRATHKLTPGTLVYWLDRRRASLRDPHASTLRSPANTPPAQLQCHNLSPG